MTRQWRILHLTDFHVADPSGTDEHLRKGFFEEYIEGLARALRAQLGIAPIDLVVITGDFVDRGAIHNFTHVEEVVKYLCEQVGVQRDSVLVCNGNHDLVRDEDKAGEYARARAAYSGFARRAGGQGEFHSDVRSRLVKVRDDVWGLTVDSTIGANGEDRPGGIHVQEVDTIVAATRQQRLTGGDLLIVASHHPPNAAFRIDGPFDETNPQWYEKHIWALGHGLFTRLAQNVPGPILWLSGDIHKAAYVIDGSVHSVVTGRFGGSTKAPASQVRRQARLLNMSEDGEANSWIFEYVPPGHVDHAQVGTWEAKPAAPERHSRAGSGRTEEFRPAVERPGVAEGGSVRTQQHQHGSEGGLDVLSAPLQREIMQIIAEEKLYSIGRYMTSPGQSTLAWIPIGLLMDQEELLVAVINEMTKWLRAVLQREKPDEPVIIGVDSWGAVLASQLSVTTGVGNFCIAARAQGITHAASERISDTVKSAVAKCDLVILISDVIGTGRTLAHVYEVLTKEMSDKQRERIKWMLLSVICDEQNDRSDLLKFAFANVTACKELRMPILHNDRLPSTDILPPDISFMR